MIEASGNEENNGNTKRELEDSLRVLQELEKEVELLNEEKGNLLNIEEELWVKILEEIERKRKMRDELRKQVEELRVKCEELTKTFNSLIHA
jgi:thiamine kinase-like enzyme